MVDRAAVGSLADRLEARAYGLNAAIALAVGAKRDSLAADRDLLFEAAGALGSVDDLLRRLAEWDVMYVSNREGGDGAYWTAEIENARAVLRALAGTRETAREDDVCRACGVKRKYAAVAACGFHYGGDGCFVAAAQAAPSEPEKANALKDAHGTVEDALRPDAPVPASAGSLGAAALPPPVESFLDEEDLAVMAMDDEPAAALPPDAHADAATCAEAVLTAASNFMALYWSEDPCCLSPTIERAAVRLSSALANLRRSQLEFASRAAVVPAGDAGQ